MSDAVVVSIPFSMKEFTRSFQSSRRSASLLLDDELNIAGSTECLRESLGYQTDELLGAAASKLLVEPGDVNVLEQHMGFLEPLPVKLCHRDGRNIETTCLLEKVHFQKEDTFLYAVHFQDCSRSLSLLQQFADTFMQDVNLGVILVDTDFKLVDISNMACRILGVRKDEIIGKPMEDVLEPVPEEHHLVQRTILDGITVRNHAISWMNGGERFELLMDSSLLRDHEGKKVGAYVMFKDVSNLRSLEEQVQRSDRLAMIGQIAAGTAHEIRNPLTSIKGFLQVMNQSLGEHGLEKERKFTEIMLAEINRINGLVSEFLLLSKAKDSSVRPVDISVILQEILPIINNEAILYNVTVRHEFPDTLPLVYADKELLKQVFLNISKNGIEAMTDGGTLTIKVQRDPSESHIKIIFHDTGPGIPNFLIDKIFDPFFTTKEEGIGLGLSVCQRIIHDMGGSIRVSSKGFGTNFTVEIPLPD